MQAAMIEQLKLGKWRTGSDAWNRLRENYDVSHLKEAVIYYKYLEKCEGRYRGSFRVNHPQMGG